MFSSRDTPWGVSNTRSSDPNPDSRDSRQTVSVPSTISTEDLIRLINKDSRIANIQKAISAGRTISSSQISELKSSAYVKRNSAAVFLFSKNSATWAPMDGKWLSSYAAIQRVGSGGIQVASASIANGAVEWYPGAPSKALEGAEEVVRKLKQIGASARQIGSIISTGCRGGAFVGCGAGVFGASVYIGMNFREEDRKFIEEVGYGYVLNLTDDKPQSPVTLRESGGSTGSSDNNDDDDRNNKNNNGKKEAIKAAEEANRKFIEELKRKTPVLVKVI